MILILAILTFSLVSACVVFVYRLIDGISTSLILFANSTLALKWSLFTLLVIFAVGQLPLRFQNEGMQAANFVYECGIFRSVQTVNALFLIPVRDVWQFVSSRWNDVIIYLRERLTHLVNDLAAIQDFATLTGITDAIHIVYDFLIAWFEWFIAVPSVKIKYLTDYLAKVIYFFNCISDVAVDFLITMIKLTLISESCSFCSYAAESKGSYCSFMHFSVSDVVPHCDNCHQLQCRAIDCVVNHIAVFLDFIPGAQDVAAQLSETICCFTSLWRRPAWIFFGFLDYLINDTNCLTLGGLATQVINFIWDIITCLDDFLQLITGGRFNSFFELLFSQVLKIVYFVVNGITQIRDCFTNPAYGKCMRGYTGTCILNGLEAVAGLQTCSDQIDKCFQKIEFLYPLNYIHLMTGVTFLFKVIDSLVCPIAITVTCFSKIKPCTDQGGDGLDCFILSLRCIETNVSLFAPFASLLDIILTGLQDAIDFVQSAVNALTDFFNRVTQVFLCVGGECVGEGFTFPFTGGAHSCDIFTGLTCIFSCYYDPHACDGGKRKRSTFENLEDIFGYQGDGDEEDHSSYSKRINQNPDYIGSLPIYRVNTKRFERFLYPSSSYSKRNDNSTSTNNVTYDEVIAAARDEWNDFLDFHGVGDNSSSPCAAIIRSKFITENNLTVTGAGDFMAYHSCLTYFILGTVFKRDYNMNFDMNRVFSFGDLWDLYTSASSIKLQREDPLYTDEVHDFTNTTSNTETQKRYANYRFYDYEYGDGDSSNNIMRYRSSFYERTPTPIEYVSNKFNILSSKLHNESSMLVVYGNDYDPSLDFTSNIALKVWKQMQSSNLYAITSRYIDEMTAINQAFVVQNASRSSNALVIRTASGNEVQLYNIADPVQLVLYERDIDDVILSRQRDYYRNISISYLNFYNEFMGEYYKNKVIKEYNALYDKKRLKKLEEMSLISKALNNERKRTAKEKISGISLLSIFFSNEKTVGKSLFETFIARNSDSFETIEKEARMITAGSPPPPNRIINGHRLKYHKDKTFMELVKDSQESDKVLEQLYEIYQKFNISDKIELSKKLYDTFNSKYDIEYWPSVRNLHLLYKIVTSPANVTAKYVEKWSQGYSYFITEGFVPKSESEEIMKRVDLTKKRSNVGDILYGDAGIRPKLKYGPFLLPHIVVSELFSLIKTASSDIRSNANVTENHMKRGVYNTSRNFERMRILSKYNLMITAYNAYMRANNLTSSNATELKADHMNITSYSSTKSDFTKPILVAFDWTINAIATLFAWTLYGVNFLLRTSIPIWSLPVRPIFMQAHDRIVEFSNQTDYADIANGTADWLIEFSTVTFPEGVNGTMFYNPFSYPLAPEGLFNWVKYLPTQTFPTQIPIWPEELVVVNCTNQFYEGVQHPFYRFSISNNCKQPGGTSVRPYCPYCDYCPQEYGSCMNDIGFRDWFDNVVFFIAALPRVVDGVYTTTIPLNDVYLPFMVFFLVQAMLISPFVIPIALFIVQLVFWAISISTTELPWGLVITLVTVTLLVFYPSLLINFPLTFLVVSIIMMSFIVNMIIPFEIEARFQTIPWLITTVDFLYDSRLVAEGPIIAIYSFTGVLSLYLLYSVVTNIWLRLGSGLGVFFIGYVLYYVDVFPVRLNPAFLLEVKQRLIRFDYPIDDAIPYLDKFCWWMTISNTALGIIIFLLSWNSRQISSVVIGTSARFLKDITDVVFQVYTRATAGQLQESVGWTNLLVASQRKAILEIKDKMSSRINYLSTKKNEIMTKMRGWKEKINSFRRGIPNSHEMRNGSANSASTRSNTLGKLKELWNRRKELIRSQQYNNGAGVVRKLNELWKRRRDYISDDENLNKEQFPEVILSRIDDQERIALLQDFSDSDDNVSSSEDQSTESDNSLVIEMNPKSKNRKTESSSNRSKKVRPTHYTKSSSSKKNSQGHAKIV